MVRFITNVDVPCCRIDANISWIFELSWQSGIFAIVHSTGTGSPLFWSETILERYLPARSYRHLPAYFLALRIQYFQIIIPLHCGLQKYSLEAVALEN